MHKPSVADLFARLLLTEGIDCVFTVPGGTALPLLAAVSALGRVRIVVAKDETGAAFAADGYAWASGKPGVVLTIGGPGATNALTALACSAVQGNPVLLVSSEVSTSLMGRRPAQDGSDLSIDVARMSGPATMLSAVGATPEKAAFLLCEALRRTVHGQQPVHVSIPFDVQGAPLERALPESSSEYRVPRAACFDRDATARAADVLRRGGKIGFLLGSGARQAGPELLRLAEALGAPVATTCGAKGVFPETHPLSLGVFSFGSGPLARAVLSSGLDTLCAFGTGLGEFATMNYSAALRPKGALIHVDLEPSVLNRDYPCLGVCGDVRVVVEELLKALEPREALGNWLEELCRSHPRTVNAAEMSSDARPIRPERVIAEIQRALPGDACVVADIGTSCLFAAHHLRLVPPQRAYIPMGWSCMAHPLAASIGIRIASRRPTLCLTGDAAFLAKGLELHAAVEAGLSRLVWVVLSNRGHGLVRLGNEKLLGGGHGVESGTFRVCPDAASIAQAVGARATRVEEPGELAKELRRAFDGGGPTLLDVQVDPEAEPPMIDRVQGLRGARRAAGAGSPS